MLNRRTNITDENGEILWQKQGDFADKSYRGGELAREVEYKNSQNAKINKVGLWNYSNGDTSIYLNLNKDHYIEVIQTLKSQGYPKPEYINESISTYRLNLPNIECLSNFLKTLETIEPKINAIAKEMIDAFTPYSKEQPSIDGWFKKYDFSRQFSSGGQLNREVVYDTTKSDSKIKQLKVLGYGDGDIVLTFKPKKSLFDGITNDLVNKGYLSPDFSDKTTGTYRISIPNVSFLDSFLQILNSIEPSIRTITSEIVECVKPYSKEEPTIPGWNKWGSFACAYSSGAGLNRSETYKSMSADTKIIKVELLGYYNGNARICLDLKKSQYNAVINPLISNGFPKPTFISSGIYSANIPNKISLNKFINIISSVEPSINAIANQIKQSYAVAKANNKNTSSFFGNFAKLRQVINNEKLISDEEMATSTFGQASNTAKRIGR